jgi:hypothetical protein
MFALKGPENHAARCSDNVHVRTPLWNSLIFAMRGFQFYSNTGTGIRYFRKLIGSLNMTADSKFLSSLDAIILVCIYRWRSALHVRDF